jgi:hypothetical protein
VTTTIATDAIAARVGAMDVSRSEAQTNAIARSDDRATKDLWCQLKNFDRIIWKDKFFLYLCIDRVHHASRRPAYQGGTFFIYL